MKGIVFTEFMAHVETHHGLVFLEDMIDECDAETKGAYTTVGTYPCSELVKLIGTLSEKTGEDISEIITGFGRQLAVSFKNSFPQYYKDDDYFDFVECVESRIHIDVRKLYPDAELPEFKTISRSGTELVVDYISARKLEHLALGLLEASAAHFDETVSVSMAPYMNGETRIVRFTIGRT